MKKIIISLMLMTVTLTAFAQQTSRYYNPQSGHVDYKGGNSGDNYFDDSMYYGFRLGMTFASVGGNSDAFKVSGTRTGLNIGGIVGISVTEVAPLFVESGLSLIQKGGRATYQGIEVKRDINYIELPVHFKYIHKLQDKIAIQPFFGPYVAYGISGKTRVGSDKVNTSFRDGGYKHWDAGIQLGVGASYDIAYIEASYNFGIANIARDPQGFDSAHNRGLNLLIGVNF